MPYQIAHPKQGTVIHDLQIPNTLAGGLHPNKIDIYIPTGPLPLRMLVGLHGGGGSKELLARQLKVATDIPSVPTPITSANVNWPLLDLLNIMICFPQGQACVGVDPILGAGNNPNNPEDVDTRSSANPEGVKTWTNHEMYSGSDDPQFIKDLALYIDANYDVQKILFGHSQGSIMTNRIWWEFPFLFSSYCTIAGPTSQWYDDNPPATPIVLRPMYSKMGRKDTIMNVYGGPYETSPLDDHFFDEDYLQDLAGLSKANVYYPSLTYRWGSCREFVYRAALFGETIGPITSLTDAGGVTSAIYVGNQTRWEAADGQLRMDLYSEANHENVKARSITGRYFLVDLILWANTLL